MKKSLTVGFAALAIGIATPVFASSFLDLLGERIDRRLDARGERWDERLDARGDRIDDWLDTKGDRWNDRLDARGDRINQRLDILANEHAQKAGPDAPNAWTDAAIASTITSTEKAIGSTPDWIGVGIGLTAD